MSQQPDIWTAYYAAFEAIRNDMEAFMFDIGRPFAAAPFFDNGEDYGFLMEVESNGRKYGVQFHLQDASGAGDDEPGKAGNLYLDVIADDGRVVTVASVANYTPECWVAYDDSDELKARLATMRDHAGDIVGHIAEDAA